MKSSSKKNRANRRADSWEPSILSSKNKMLVIKTFLILTFDCLVRCGRVLPVADQLQQKQQAMQFPEQTYRWMVSLNIIPNQGQQSEAATVTIHSPLTAHFESGFNIAMIVRSILKRSGNKPPQILENVKKETTKNAKLTNWNFIWLSFDDLRMKFDNRIKDLILQGEQALIVQIAKQLCERDQHKDQSAMKGIAVQGKGTTRTEKSVRNGGNKGSVFDVKRLNLQKNPQESESSLEFLVLLLASSLDMSVQEILGLFTNQNKYLAHVIVKGINEDFTGVRLFYSLLIKYSGKLKEFISQNLKDAESCLYAIKPGFISKDAKVAELTIQVFGQIGNIYHWLVGENTKGATTIFLGIKRHPHFVDQIWELLEQIMGENYLNFFTSHFKLSFMDQREMIEICQELVRPVSNSFIKDRLVEVGIFSQWLQITCGLFEGDVEEKILSLSFVGEMMLWMPESVAESEGSLQLFKKGWQERTFIDYIMILDEIFTILDKLASNKSKYASKIYQFLIQIFQEVCEDKFKKEYLVQNFSPIIPLYPKMPTHYFIQAYKGNHLDAIDHQLISTAIEYSDDLEGLVKIGEVLLRMFAADSVVNGYLGPNIYTIAARGAHDQIGEAFVSKAVKDLLHAYGLIESHKMSPKIAKKQPNYFGHKGNTSNVLEDDVITFAVKQKQAANLLELVNKLCDLQKTSQLQTTLKNELLNTNSLIRKHNFKVTSRSLASILKKFGVTKEEESEYDDQRNKKDMATLEQSLARRKHTEMRISRVSTGPAHLRRQFTEMVEKRKKDEEDRKAEEDRKEKQKAYKQTLMKKQIQKQKLIRGYGSGEAELKEEGFWQKLIKEDKELQIYPATLMEQKDLDYIDTVLKKYHRIVRHLFVRYTSSMHSVKSINNFDDNLVRKETITLVEVIKFLRDYKLLFLTSNQEVQSLIRDVNVKILNKRQTTQEMDFNGFQQFLIQFAAVIFTKPHTINAKINGKLSTMLKSYNHISHGQLLQEIFRYLKMVFQEKGESTAMFDEPEAAYFNETQVIREFNKKLQDDPGFILPEGYKKVVEKMILWKPQVGENNKINISEPYLDVIEVLDEIIYSSPLRFHILEPISQKTTKVRVKPNALGNVKTKLLSESALPVEGKVRAMSSVVEKKAHIPPVKMLERKVFSLGMKLGLSYISYKDKLLGQQVAYVMDDMLTAVEQGRATIQKQKIVNEAMKKRKEAEQLQKRLQTEREKKRKQRKEELQKQKKEITDKKKQEEQNNKQEKQKKRLQAIQREKKKKEEMEKYLSEQKAKLKEKRQKEEEQKAKQKEEKKKKKEEVRKAKERFNQYSQKQVQKLHKQFEEAAEKKKKSQAEIEEEKKHKEQMYKKLKEKIKSQEHRKFGQIKQKKNQQISELFNSEQITQVFQKFDLNLKATYEFLIKNTYLSLTERKHNHEVVLEAWNFFGKAFQLNPFIIDSKEMLAIFRAVTIGKQVRKQFYIGMNFQQFQQALLRVAIKHKSIFNKIAEKIKEDDMDQGEINDVINKDIEQKEQNQFDEVKEIDVKGLAVEEDINREIFDDYGDVKKVSPITLKGLIYYLKVPKDRAGQQKRFREILVKKKPRHSQKFETLKQKLQQDYSLKSPIAKKKTEESHPNIVKQAQQEGGEKDEAAN